MAGKIKAEQEVRSEVRRIIQGIIASRATELGNKLMEMALKQDNVVALKEALDRGMGKEANSLHMTPDNPIKEILEEIQSKKKSIVTDK